MLDGQARRALAAADVVLVASGTATLETALFRRPWWSPTSWASSRPSCCVRSAGEDPAFLAAESARGQELVPEFFQEAASAENLADALAHWLDHPEEVRSVQREFAPIHTAPALRWRRARRCRNRRVGRSAAGAP
jgi:lipid-A-disaccharide synthase